MTYAVSASRALALSLAVAAIAIVAQAQTTTPASVLAAYTAQAGKPASPERGQALFNRKFGRDFDSCATCHGAVPTRPGKDAVSEKPIAPLAPAAQPGRFSDRSKVDYRFQMNCRDVIGRDCTAAEKADVLAWLISLNP
jgi:mono/diheme cytochrome c family protein